MLRRNLDTLRGTVLYSFIRCPIYFRAPERYDICFDRRISPMEGGVSISSHSLLLPSQTPENSSLSNYFSTTHNSHVSLALASITCTNIYIKKPRQNDPTPSNMWQTNTRPRQTLLSKWTATLLLLLLLQVKGSLNRYRPNSFLGWNTPSNSWKIILSPTEFWFLCCKFCSGFLCLCYKAPYFLLE